MQVRTIRSGFEAFECKFKTFEAFECKFNPFLRGIEAFECKFESFESNSKHSNANSNHWKGI